MNYEKKSLGSKLLIRYVRMFNSDEMASRTIQDKLMQLVGRKPETKFYMYLVKSKGRFCLVNYYALSISSYNLSIVD